MPIGEPRMRRRVRNLAAERRKKQKERTRGKGESRKELAVTRRKVPRRAKVARRKRNIARKECTRVNVVQEIKRGRTFGRIRQQKPKYNNGIRRRDFEEPPHLRTRGKPPRVSEEGREESRHD
jgi:hypothetical protein